VQNSVQHQAAGGRNALLPTKQGQQKPLKNKPVRRSAVACNLGQMASVPPLGETQTVKTTGHSEDSQTTGAHMVQLEDLKSLLSSLDPDLLQKLLVEILKE